jgi:hypothetical protein
VQQEKKQIIGIIATKGVNRPATKQDPFPGRTATFREISRLARQDGVSVAVFSPWSIDRKRRQVRAHVFVPGRGWIQSAMPLPRVIYNRVANRRMEARPRIQRLLRWLKSEGVVVFNPRFLDKWEVYACLQADPQIKPHVPETVLYENFPQLLSCLREWRTVYCKPRRGSLGTGIAVLQLTADGSVVIKRNGIDIGTHLTRVRQPAALRRWAARYLRPGRTCLQKGVELAAASGRRFDIRVLVQKDETGAWRFTGAAARLAGHGQITTHVPRGGRRMSLDKALHAVWRNRAVVDRIKADLATLAQDAAQSLETALADKYGEFSLDVGVDKERQLWIFEMNAKPFRFDEPKIRHKAYRRLIGFSKQLTSG